MRITRKTTCITLAVIASIVAAFMVGKKYFSNEPINYEYLDYQLRLELDYWDTKYAVVEEIDKWMNSNCTGTRISPIILLNECDRYNVDIRLPLAQGYLESHMGTRGLGKKINCPWNVGAYNGKSENNIHKKFIYNNPNESIVPYLELITKKYLGNTKTEEDLMVEFVNLSGKRYASSKTYESDLRNTWNKINSETKLDSLLLVYDNLKISTNR